jgi:hypothetical protein
LEHVLFHNRIDNASDLVKSVKLLCFVHFPVI